MARHEAAAAAGVDFHLPDEILAVIPTDPYEQLDVARKITSMAIASRVSRLEADVARLRRDLADRDRAEADLRARLADSDARLLAALDENAKLAKERDSLASTAKKMARNLAKLEAFKKQLMKSLSEDNLLQLSETGDDRDLDTDNNLTARVPSWKAEVSSSRTSGGTSSISTMTESAQGHQFSITPYTAPKLTPGSTPIISSSGGSPRASSAKFLSGPTSPTRSLSEGQSTFSSWHGSSSYQYSAPTSPPQHRSFAGRPRIDGKEFFRQARTRLSYEQFGAFLANIKEFNAQKQSREGIWFCWEMITVLFIGINIKMDFVHQHRTTRDLYIKHRIARDLYIDRYNLSWPSSITSCKCCIPTQGPGD
uniref:At4g15545-like C-terminal domain-containing protein n=1 Tax=Leersia perrieri TaxID=77586 RepID=A0A0D9W9G4_9ORYZ